LSLYYRRQFDDEMPVTMTNNISTT